MSDRSVNEPSSTAIAPGARTRAASIDRHRRTNRSIQLAIAVLLSIGVMGSSLPPPAMLAQSAAVEAAPSKAKSELEKRFNRFGVNEKGLSREAMFRRQAKALLNSDPIEDARTDIAAGHIGFMTVVVRSWGADQPFVPGVLDCFGTSGHRAFVSANSLFEQMFISPFRLQEGKARELYRGYSYTYNRLIVPHMNKQKAINTLKEKCLIKP